MPSTNYTIQTLKFKTGLEKKYYRDNNQNIYTLSINLVNAIFLLLSNFVIK